MFFRLLVFSLALGALTSLCFAQDAPEVAPTQLNVLPVEVRLVAEGFNFTEGPVWNARGFYLFSDIPENTLFKATIEGKTAVVRQPTGHSNGNAYDAQGRFVSCEHDRRVSRKAPDKTFQTLADSFEGKRLNSPNDLAIRSDGSIYFSDPTFGIKRDQSELGFSGLFRLFSDGKLELLDKEWQQPNGLCFSPDEKRLYVGDSKAGQLWVFDVNAKGELLNKTLLDTIPKPGDPDGMKCDSAGRLFLTAGKSVRVYNPSGELEGVIPVPQTTTNLCFGGADGKQLFITAGKAVYVAQVP